jgi:3-dehydroquinate dehydratase-2
MKHIHIINGANLNLLGKREPEIYGSLSFEDFFTVVQEEYKKENVLLSHFQSNYEGAIIDNIHEQLNKNLAGLIINAGAYTHYSYAISDALRILTCPIVEVHISNIFARESFRHISVISPVVKGTITGLGLQGYTLAIKYLMDIS